MNFKKRRSINLSYNKQGLIYFTCINYGDQPEHIRRKIYELCEEVGGEYSKALFTLLTRSKSVLQISLEFYVSETKLYMLRKQFYEAWSRYMYEPERGKCS